MKNYSFKLSLNLLKSLKVITSNHIGRTAFRNYLLYEYELAKEIDVNLDESTYTFYTLRLRDVEINKINLIISKAKQNGLNFDRSQVLNDIISKFNKTIKNNPLSKPEIHKQRFSIPAGTKERLGNFLLDGTLINELSSFILDEYKPTNEFSSMRSQDQEDIFVVTDKEVFDKLDEYAASFGFQKGGRAKLFRNALLNFEEKLAEDSPKKLILSQELERIILEFKKIEEIDKIKNMINNYLD
ncbi:hypothetical protein ACQRXC_29190 (plasmid) [Niallia taxi]|uniref:hypothetical protein n=1 Tax=Niallia taxi TaxID=2499688 RepID=UPI003F627A79